MTIVTVFDLEEWDRIGGKALFKQRPPLDRLGRFHHWSMDESDWDALGRTKVLRMTLSPYVEESP